MNQKAHVKRVAIKLVKKHGLINLSLKGLCDIANIPAGSFPHIMGMTFSDLVTELGEHDTGKQNPVTKSRANPILRKEQILDVAIELARKDGCHKITRDNIAHKAGVSEGLVSSYFGTMSNLKRSVMRAAIARGIPEIIAKGLANNDPYARKASAELKALAASTLI